MTKQALSKDAQAALVTRARDGEQPAKDALVVSFLPGLCAMASKYIYTHFHNRHNVECDDLVGEAIITILETLDTALTKEDPCAFLMKAAKRTMVEYYIHGHTDTIRTHHQFQDPIPVVSLDARVANDATTLFADLCTGDIRLEKPQVPEEAYAALYQAIAALPEKQQAIIRRCFPLGIGDTPTTLNEMSRQLSPNSPRPANAHYHKRCALNALRAYLTSATVSQCVVGGAAC